MRATPDTDIPKAPPLNAGAPERWSETPPPFGGDRAVVKGLCPPGQRGGCHAASSSSPRCLKLALAMTGSPLTSCLPLATAPSAVPVARTFVRRALLHWELAFLIEDASIITSELVTNAIKVTHEFNAPQPSSSPMVKIQLCLAITLDLAVIEVWDPDPALPVVPEKVDPLEESGRGLFLVDHLAKSWGFRHPDIGGKTVWCQLR